MYQRDQSDRPPVDREKRFADLEHSLMIAPARAFLTGRTIHFDRKPTEKALGKSA
jgi:hypothetical protein